MPRLWIDISAQEHQKLKAMAARKGQSTKDEVPRRAPVDIANPAAMADAEALRALEALLIPRLDEGAVVTATAVDISREARVRQGRRASGASAQVA